MFHTKRIDGHYYTNNSNILQRQDYQAHTVSYPERFGAKHLDHGKIVLVLQQSLLPVLQDWVRSRQYLGEFTDSFHPFIHFTLHCTDVKLEEFGIQIIK